MATLEQNLSLEQKELVAVGASVGAGCHPCADHHLKAGAKAGLDGEQLLAALTSAERVAAEAAVLIGEHVRAKLGPTVAEPALLSRLEEALASFGAALGANNATNIERRLRTALDSGATKPQLQQAIETAKTVQENAARIHLREAERLLDALAESVVAPESKAEPDRRCGCEADEEDKPPVPSAEAADPRRWPRPSATTKQARIRAKNPLRAAPIGRQSCSLPRAAASRPAPLPRWRIAAPILERACREPTAPAETNDPPTAVEAAGPCRKES